MAIHDIDGLTNAICLALANKSDYLTGAEFRYLRSAGMLLSVTALALMMGVNTQTVTRWEGHGRLPEWADRLIRALFIAHVEAGKTTS